MSKGVGDVVGFHSSSAAIVGVVCADGSVIGNGLATDVHDKASECLAWA